MVFKNVAAYQMWAGNKMRSIVADLSEDEYEKKIIADRSVKDICTHILLALETCCIIAENSDDQSGFERIEKATKDELLAMWQERDSGLATIIREIPQGKIMVPHISETPFEIDLIDFYFQYMIHTTHHRGQLAMFLRALGKDVPGTDYLMYFEEQAEL
ncbi:MAG: DinB family protein [Promethearchaeota archaeon]